MFPLLQQLTSLGLNHFEAKIYFHLLQQGELPASKIAQQTSVPRNTTRGILDRLCEQGLMSKLYRRNTQYYRCKPPESLVDFVDEKMEHLQTQKQEVLQLLPDLHKMFVHHAIMPKVQFFEGAKQVIEVFNQCLFEEDVTELLLITSYRYVHEPVFRKYDEETFVPNRVKKGIKLRVLVGQEDQPYTTPDKKELREKRSLPPECHLPGNFHIYGNKILYFSTENQEYIAVLVESELMAGTLRALFECLWSSSTEKGTRNRG